MAKNTAMISATKGTDSFCTNNNKSKVIILGDLNDDSVRSQSTDATDTSSIESNADDDDSTLASLESFVDDSENDAPYGITSALKCENSPRRMMAQQNARIRFSPTVQLKGHLARHEFTTQELDSCWLRGEDYTKIANSCRIEIKMIEQGTLLKNFLDNDDHRKYYSRGLESHTRLAAIAKSHNRLAARDAVFDEQGDQLSLGVVDDETIASRYCDASSSSTYWAIRVGQQDLRMAELVYDMMLD